MIRLPISAGTALIGSLASGLALSPVLETSATGQALAGFVLVLALLSAVAGRRGISGTWLACGLAAAAVALALGLLIGQARLTAIDAGAFQVGASQPIVFRGYLESPPRANQYGVRLHLAGPLGKVAVISDQLESTPPVGSGLTVTGQVEEPPEYLRAHLRRLGISHVIRADSIEQGHSRGGPGGFLDLIRERALVGMGAGMRPREAALSAGFVLGQDGAIDSTTEEDFRRSGLAHLVAASGQNVMLLILLATVPLALAGVRLKHRLPWLIAVVLVYLPLTGAGPSIQRAAVMGVVMLLVLWLGGGGSRLLALLVAAALTLLANPRASGDAGWQLSFAATVGIMLLGSDLRRLLLSAFEPRAGKQSRPPAGMSSLRRALADGTAMTIAATLATAPLIAHHFGALPLATLSANLLAMPAVAPVMWMGMVAGLAGQLPAIPTEPINWLNAMLISYVAEVAGAVSDLPAGVAEFDLTPGWLVIATEIGLLGAAWAFLRYLRKSTTGTRTAQLLSLALAIVVLAPVAAAFVPAGWLSDSSRTPEGLRIVALDVGQGDAILVQLGDANLLIDTGPPQAGIGRRLQRYGVKRLDALFITHADLDHVGGLNEVHREFEIDRLLYADPPSLEQSANVIDSRPENSVALGQRLRLGEAEIEVLWPPPLGDTPSVDSNSRSLVLLLKWRSFKALFTGDAEAEAAPYNPGDIDLLKVAHHGSADQGLPTFLTQTTPEVALISAGRDNRHGHPHPTTLSALKAAGVKVHRTDLEGDLVVKLP